MSRTLTVCRSGFSVAAAVVLLSACGGSGGKSASSSSSAGSSASKTSAAAAGSDFCTKAAAIESSVTSAVANQADPSSIPQALQTAAAQIRAIDPPSEIASDWNALAGGIEQLATAFAAVDLKDQNAVAAFEQQASQLESQLSGPSANVEKYLSDKCGLMSSTDSSAPTS
jgi:hypothetical protein